MEEVKVELDCGTWTELDLLALTEGRVLKIRLLEVVEAEDTKTVDVVEGSWLDVAVTELEGINTEELGRV